MTRLFASKLREFLKPTFHNNNQLMIFKGWSQFFQNHAESYLKFMEISKGIRRLKGSDGTHKDSS
jgi:hypothetical protein